MNKFARVLKISIKGSKQITVSSTNIFTAGKEVYIIQMKGSNDSQSMFARVVTVDSKNSTIIINAGLTFHCNSTGSNRCQVVTVPHFENVTLKARATISGGPWNGETGGIIVFRSKQIVCNLDSFCVSFIRSAMRHTIVCRYMWDQGRVKSLQTELDFVEEDTERN